MDAELKAKWVSALRSGQYQQHRDGTLYDRKTGAYCCLGVLAQVSGLMLDLDGKPRSAGHLSHDYDVVSEDHQRTLWRMNDGYDMEKRRNFSEIADWIEANL